MNALKFLQRPYQVHNRFRDHLLPALGFGAFVFLFLYIFQPFGLRSLPRGLLPVTLAYGAVTAAVMLLLSFFGTVVFSRFMAAENWTVGREIFWTLLNFIAIGTANMLLTHGLEFAHISVSVFFYTQAITLAVGILPVSIFVLLRESFLHRHYGQRAEHLSRQLAGNSFSHSASQAREALVLPSQNKGEDLHLAAEDLWLMIASDNYVEVVYRKGNTLQRSLLRAPLKQMEESLSGEPQFFRCHKSFMVNLNKVEHVSGNAQGYKLKLTQWDDPVPVSRQHNHRIHEKLSRSSH